MPWGRCYCCLEALCAHIVFWIFLFGVIMNLLRRFGDAGFLRERRFGVLVLVFLPCLSSSQQSSVEFVEV